MKLVQRGIRKLKNTSNAISIARFDVDGQLITKFKKFDVSEYENKKSLKNDIAKWYNSVEGMMVDNEVLYLTDYEENELRSIL